MIPEVEEDIQGLFKLPNIPTNQDTDISPTPSPTPTPANEEPNIIKVTLTEDTTNDSDNYAAAEDGNTDTFSQVNVEWTRQGRRIVRPSHLTDFILDDNEWALLHEINSLRWIFDKVFVWLLIECVYSKCLPLG